MIKLILVLGLTFFISQTFKFVIDSFSMGKLYFWSYLQDGGMPSTHSAVVTSLTLVVYFNQGFSLLFFVVFVFSLIILNDAMKVRYETELEAKDLNKVMRKLHILHKTLNERVGHKPLQVLAGIMLGFIISLIFYL
ncbi:divergent PAP2 family protein [Candidatus Woesearchaeota archaeon]|nr:divergent PAP2 family protein [Candidatus Woesearchaeota archaeon]